MGYLILTTFISWAQNLRHISFSTIEQQAKEFLFGYARHIPMVVAKLKEEKSKLETILDNPAAKQVGRTAASILTRTLLGALGLRGTTTRRRKSSSWF